MAIPKRGSRNIVVNEEPYRWYLRRRPTNNQLETSYPDRYMGLAVEHAEAKGNVLAIIVPYRHPSLNWGVAEHSIVPADVEEYIQTALARGWQPKQPGKTFTLDMTENE